jgi:hypothetical protein
MPIDLWGAAGGTTRQCPPWRSELSGAMGRRRMPVRPHRSSPLLADHRRCYSRLAAALGHGTVAPS